MFTRFASWEHRVHISGPIETVRFRKCHPGEEAPVPPEDIQDDQHRYESEIGVVAIVFVTFIVVVLDGNNVYMAPEAVNNLAYNEKVDIYSFGVILRLLLSGSAAAPPPPVEGEEETVTDTEGSPTNARNAVVEPARTLVSTSMQLLIGVKIYIHTVSTVSFFL